MHKFKDLSGQKIGRLLVIKRVLPNIKGKIYYECLCDCGNLKNVYAGNLRRKDTKSCGCLYQEFTQNQKYNWKGYGEFDGSFLNHIKSNAKQRNLIVEIDIKYLWELYEKQERKCALSGINLNYNTVYKRENNLNSNNVSLDRIDSNKGYLKNNIQFVHKDINKMKLNYPNNYFIKLCNNIYDYQNFGISEIINIKPGTKRKLKYFEITKTFYSRLYHTAKDRNIKLDISIEQLYELYLLQNKCCKLSGVPIVFRTKYKDNTASLDRIDSNKEYRIDNVQFLHKDINMIKQDYNMDYFLNLVYKIANYNW